MISHHLLARKESLLFLPGSQVGTRSTNWIKLSWAWPKLDVLVWLGPKWFGLDQMHLLSSYPKLNHLVLFSLA